MTLDELKDYFRIFVSDFTPFRDDQLHKVLVEYLLDYYFYNLYQDIPKDFRSLYEDSEILDSVYNQLLIGIGLQESVVRQLSFNEKLVFLESLSDFQRYKSTISFVQKLCSTFVNDHLNVYELFVDRDSFGNWIFRPYLIYKDGNVDELTTTLDYDEIYNQVPSLLIDTIKLNSLYSQEDIVLPLKSNLLLLDFEFFQEAKLFNNYVISIFLDEYGDEPVNLYLDDFNTVITLRNLIYVWYYLLSEYYGTTWYEYFASDQYVIHFGIPPTDTILDVYPMPDDPNQWPYEWPPEESSAGQTNYGKLYECIVSSIYGGQVSNVHNLLTGESSDSLSTTKIWIDPNARTRIDEFYKERILDNFKKYETAGSSELTTDDMLTYIGVFNLDLKNYLDERITSSNNKKLEIEKLLEGIFNSLRVFEDEIQELPDTIAAQKKYHFSIVFEKILQTLPQAVVSPKKTKTYTILFNLKPFHTELVSRSKQSFIVDDPFESAFPYDNDEHTFQINMQRAGALSISDPYRFHVLYQSNDDEDKTEWNFEDSVEYLIKYFFEDEYQQEPFLVESRDDFDFNLLTHQFETERVIPNDFDDRNIDLVKRTVDNVVFSTAFVITTVP